MQTDTAALTYASCGKHLLVVVWVLVRPATEIQPLSPMGAKYPVFTPFSTQTVPRIHSVSPYALKCLSLDKYT